MKKRVLMTLAVASVFSVSTMVFPWVRTAQAAQVVPKEVSQEIKGALLSHLAQTYNRLVDLREDEVRGVLLSDLLTQEKELLARVSSLEDQEARQEVFSAVTVRMSELREKISGLSKAEVLENLLVAQEELSHLGAEQILKGIAAVLVSVLMLPFVIVGGALIVVGATVSVASLGLLSPIGGAIILAGLLLAGGAFAAATVTWDWALQPGF